MSVHKESETADPTRVTKDLVGASEKSNVYSFSPDATAAEKAALAKSKEPVGKGPVSEIPSSDINTTKTPAASSSSSTLPSSVYPDQSPSDSDLLVPGGITSAVSDVPDWVRVGWNKVAELEATDQEKDIFEAIIGDIYYGKLWLNVGAVFVGILLTWIITALGFGFGWVALLAVVTATYFKNSSYRFYRATRNKIIRELSQKRLETDLETTEWLNEFIRRFWLIFEPVLSSMVVQKVDAILAASTPAFLDSIRLSTFTLGTKPLRVESVKSYPRVEDDIVVMDWKFALEPNDVVGLTQAQLHNKVNPKIILTVHAGKGATSTKIPIILENMSFSGHLKIQMKLINTFPHIQTVDVSFLEPPKLDFVLKPIGGEMFGFDIALIPGLISLIHDTANAVLSPMLYHPNIFTLDLEDILGGYPIEMSAGVLKLVIHNAEGLKNVETFGCSDPYVKVLVHGNKEVARTKVIDDTLNPHWNETHYLILTTLAEPLHLALFDANLSKDKPLGNVVFECLTLNEKPIQDSITSPVILDGQEHGTLTFDAEWYPVIHPKPNEPLPESNSGILRLMLNQAKDLDASKSVVGQYNPYAELILNKMPVRKTKTVRKTNNPIWNEHIEIFVTNKAAAQLGIIVRDERGFAEDPAVGVWRSDLTEFMKSIEKKNDWFNLTSAATGKIRLGCLWMPVLMDSVPHPAGYVNAIGIVKLKIKSAKGLKNLETFRGQSDPYVIVSLGSTFRSRTEVINNNLNPEWQDEYHYVPVHTNKEIIVLNVMDFEDSGSDRRLGRTQLHLSDLVNKNDDGLYVASKSLDISAPLVFENKEEKGELFYEASFHPALVQPAKTEKKSQGGEEKVIETSKTSKDINIFEYQSGTLIINIHQAKVDKKNVFVECFIDGEVYPFYKTESLKVPDPIWETVTDVAVKELDFSRLTIRLVQRVSNELIAVYEEDVKSLLRRSKLEDGVWLTSSASPDVKLNISLDYIPTNLPLEPSESVSNQGLLVVTVKDAKDLPAADRSGTSDPYIVFTYNNEKIFKTKTVKENLNPVYDERFQVQIKSRTASNFYFEVFDWNRITSATLLGTAQINLNDLPALEAIEREIPISGGKGSVRLILLFRPEFVKKEARVSSFVAGAKVAANVGSGAAQVASNSVRSVVSSGGAVGKAGVNAVGTAAGAAAGLVSGGAKFMQNSERNGENGMSSNRSSTYMQQPGGVSSARSSMYLDQSGEIVGMPGTLTLHVIEAKDLPPERTGPGNPFVRIKVNKKDFYKTQVIKKSQNPKWDEVTVLKDLTGVNIVISFGVKFYNRITANVDIGDYEMVLWDHILPGKFNEDFWADLGEGKGKLHVKLEFVPK
ncbi:536_t:CDS:10 [Paraglomus occultum]|uniref:536_t:CDS:1 n=1 Tax=Paraglomus occultum TaxID=144539 RepID=A0A9N9AD71_9GLOM|nr:536_t:CDS:10 [Paraglomus occultum]